MKNKKNKPTLKSIHDFFEHPDNVWGYLVQAVILVMIFGSVAMTILEFFYGKYFGKHMGIFHAANSVILVVFTVEYILRLVSAPKKWRFVRKPANIVDLVAIAPNYIELILPFFIPTQELRILRLLRLSRLLRVLKLFEYNRLIKKVFVFKDSILEVIFPVLLIFAALKGIIWFLEVHDLWFTPPDLTNLLGTMGSALGIILSQKIAVSYSKFLGIEETITNIYGKLRSLSIILDHHRPKTGQKAVSQWAAAFLSILKNPQANNLELHIADRQLYKTIATVEPETADLAMLYGDISKDATYCLSKKTRITPRVYDILLHQVTVLYILLLAALLPGMVGLGAVLVATCLLYGMYELTEDLDTILGGKHNLISINVNELELLAESEAKNAM